MAAAQQRLQGRADLLIRESGGGAVLTGPWLVSVSIVLPLGHPWLSEGLLESYRHLGQLHVATLREFGITAHSLSPQELPQIRKIPAVRSTDWACFGSLSPWEVVSADGRKLVGLAQRRCQSGVLLVCGTLVDCPDWSLLCDVMGHPQEASILQQATVSCVELRGYAVEPERMADVLAQWLARSLA